MGDIVQFPQNGFGATEKKISESPDQIYRMVRASLRGLRFVSEPEEPARSRGHRHEEHKVSDRKLAEQMLAYSQRVVAKEARASNEEIEYLIDLMRATAEVTRPVTVDQFVDFSFLAKARKDSALTG
jgi:ABC-type nitrate/sulfonate/bicarbonate transport system substrate-binding protein